MARILRGEIRWADLNPVRGREQAGSRPVLILRLTATDLGKAMLDYARGKLADRRGIEWREADALRLPFADGEFGAVVCI